MVAKGMLKRHAEQCQFRPQQCEWGQENILLRNMKVLDNLEEFDYISNLNQFNFY